MQYGVHSNSGAGQQIQSQFATIQGAPIKNNPLEKLLYISNGSSSSSRVYLP